jgi:hypothetical protein
MKHATETLTETPKSEGNHGLSMHCLNVSMVSMTIIGIRTHTHMRAHATRVSDLSLRDIETKVLPAAWRPIGVIEAMRSARFTNPRIYT